jgi:hypothetical protein
VRKLLRHQLLEPGNNVVNTVLSNCFSLSVKSIVYLKKYNLSHNNTGEEVEHLRNFLKTLPQLLGKYVITEPKARFRRCQLYNKSKNMFLI